MSPQEERRTDKQKRKKAHNLTSSIPRPKRALDQPEKRHHRITHGRPPVDLGDFRSDFVAVRMMVVVVVGMSAFVPVVVAVGGGVARVFRVFAPSAGVRVVRSVA